jgi:hypothetical protein
MHLYRTGRSPVQTIRVGGGGGGGGGAGAWQAYFHIAFGSSVIPGQFPIGVGEILLLACLAGTPFAR